MGQPEYAAYPASGRRAARPQRRASGLLYAPRHENDPAGTGILDKGAQVFLTTCNPTTVQDDVVAWLVERGAEACAWRNMSDADWQQSWEKAIAWQPTHLCEMGADITTLLHQRGEFGNIVAGLEATGSGVNRLGDIQPGYPIFNWDDLPVKEGLHNRHMVGLTAWHTFFQTTHLTLHEKKCW